MCDKESLNRFWCRSKTGSENFLSGSSPLSDRVKTTLHDILKSYGWIRTKLGGHVGCVTRRNWSHFGEDSNPDPDTRIL